MDKGRLEAAIQKAHQVLRTKKQSGWGPFVDTTSFREWRTQTLNLLEDTLGGGHSYTVAFRQATEDGEPRDVEDGLGVLNAIFQDQEGGFLSAAKPSTDPLTIVAQICEGFHRVTRQLRQRYDSRATLDVSDEYDVQDLLHALLVLHFEDIRPEEYTPSYAGGSSRMDFLLKRERLVIEVKRTRASLSPKVLGGELIEDIARYESHPDCGELVCFVYDPEGRLPNPRGIETDLGRDDGPFPVTVLVRPL